MRLNGIREMTRAIRVANSVKEETLVLAAFLDRNKARYEWLQNGTLNMLADTDKEMAKIEAISIKWAEAFMGRSKHGRKTKAGARKPVTV